MIIQAIPGSGKTHLARRGIGVDSDDVLAGFGLKGKSGFETLMLSDTLRSLMRAELVGRDADGLIVMCNFDPALLGVKVAARFTYRPQDYVSHLRLVGRKDLTSSFSESDLRAWAEDYTGKSGVYWMREGSSLSDALQHLADLGDLRIPADVARRARLY